MNNPIDFWLEDLRTTTDPQTTGRLSDLNGDCCLGRLCKVAIKAGVPVRVRLVYNRHADKFTGNTAYTYNGERGAVPGAVEEWSGVPFSTQVALVELNDEKGYSFSQIADYIEARRAR